MPTAYEKIQRDALNKYTPKSKRTSSDGYMVMNRTHTPPPVKEGDTRYNDKLHQRERYSPEGKWVPIGKRPRAPQPTENKTDRAKEWGVGQK